MTEMTPEKALWIITNNTEPHKEREFPFNKLPVYSKCFRGTVSNNRFKVVRNLSYRNPGLPVVKGKIEPSNGGSAITITMRIHFLIFCFICFLTLFSLKEPYRVASVLFIVLFLFWIQAYKQKKKLVELLKN